MIFPPSYKLALSLTEEPTKFPFVEAAFTPKETTARPTVATAAWCRFPPIDEPRKPNDVHLQKQQDLKWNGCPIARTPRSASNFAVPLPPPCPSWSSLLSPWNRCPDAPLTQSLPRFNLYARDQTLALLQPQPLLSGKLSKVFFIGVSPGKFQTKQLSKKFCFKHLLYFNIVYGWTSLFFFLWTIYGWSWVYWPTGLIAFHLLETVWSIAGIVNIFQLY